MKGISKGSQNYCIMFRNGEHFKMLLPNNVQICMLNGKVTVIIHILLFSPNHWSHIHERFA